MTRSRSERETGLARVERLAGASWASRRSNPAQVDSAAWVMTSAGKRWVGSGVRNVGMNGAAEGGRVSWAFEAGVDASWGT